MVSGAGSPIGRAVVQRLRKKKALLVLADIDAAALAEATELAGDQAVTVTGDLSDREVATNFAQAALNAFGRIDILVNNAGGGIIKPFTEHTPETMKTTIDRNLWTCLWCCWAVLPTMKAQGYGRIVNIGADSVRNGLAEHAVYNAAKGGVHGLTTGLATEFANADITINTVAPCIVNTPVVQKGLAAGSPRVAEFLKVVPKGRPGEPAEIASMVAYLASEEAAFITGQVVSVNGGSTML